MALDQISPFAAFLASFSDTAWPAWVLLIIAAAVYWSLLVVPQIALLSYMDRKLGADVQMRIGPNRVGPYGIIQPVADFLKLFFQEELSPKTQERALFRWGPLAAVVCVVWAVGSIPMADHWVLSSPESGLILVVCALTLSHLCLFWAGYSVESAWSALSSFRMLASAALYLVPIAMSLIPPVLISGSVNLFEIMASQGGYPWRWNAFHDPGAALSCLVLFASLQFWQGRLPMDFARADGEIAGGSLVEYSGLRKGIVSSLQHLGLFLSCALLVTVYFGGGAVPFDLESLGRAANLVQWTFFTIKVFATAWVLIWIRWSLPRMRIDQAIRLSWKILLPAGIAGALLSAFWAVVTGGRGLGDFL